MSSLQNYVSQVVFGTLADFYLLESNSITNHTKKLGDSIFIFGVIGPAKCPDEETTFLIFLNTSVITPDGFV